MADELTLMVVHAHPDHEAIRTGVLARYADEGVRTLPGRLYLLGYRDSGMMGAPDNAHPSSFHQASLEGDSPAGAPIRRRRPW